MEDCLHRLWDFPIIKYYTLKNNNTVIINNCNNLSNCRITSYSIHMFLNLKASYKISGKI